MEESKKFFMITDKQINEIKNIIESIKEKEYLNQINDILESVERQELIEK